MSRITIRFSEEENKTIDDFLERHPEFNKSSLIRESTRYLIHQERNAETGNVTIYIDDKTLEMFDNLIDFNYFRDYSDIINYVFKTITSRGVLKQILDNYIDQRYNKQ